MKQTSDYLPRNSDSELAELYYTLYQPETEVKATLLILHGMQEHSGRYADFAKFLAQQGFAVLTYDHLGHGKTAKTPEEMGFFTLNNPKKQLIQDASSMASILEMKYPDTPHLIMGHSMGSFITRCFLKKHSARFHGAVIMGTGGPRKGLEQAKHLLALLNSVAPESRSELISNVFGAVCNMNFKDEENDHGTNWLSVNKENRKAFMTDPLCGAPFSHNAFFTLFSLMDTATADDWAKSISREFPFIFVSGSDDPVGDFSKGVELTTNHLQADGFKNVQLSLYKGMRHEILNEEVKDQVYGDILLWLNAVLKG
ncbi:MAG: lysophospholipase [Chryseobacterium sp.]|jgi:alpha-beta hydrolase superfamily lysophospholipase|uniref:alpha/beta fold hydrolase n=1 Tax=Chryseobacterium sp. TaxID=1871047 RepID=UPI00281E1378|nr:alpha/beta fold hydrolase [Chryseobacterium sp.]MDR2236848.1 lysophospholipase [Chryseobacterium sp.]